MSKNSTTEQKLSPIEEKLLKEITHLGECISILDDYYVNLKRVPIGNGEFPEFGRIENTLYILPIDPKAREQVNDDGEVKYDEWFDIVDNVITPISGKFYNIYRRIGQELESILNTKYDLGELCWWRIHEDGNNLLDKIKRISNAIIELREKKRGEVELQQHNSENINAEGKKKNSFDDVKLKMNVDWKGNYSNSHYEVSVTCNNPLDNEFNLAFRFMPVLYLLVKGVNENTTCVRNKELKNAYRDPDEAKKEIIKAFIRVIGQRAKKIIKIEQGIGKKLMIPRKNITLKLQKPVA